MKLSSEWHKSVQGRIDVQIILYAKTGTLQYIMAPERDIRAVGDMADPSLGVWFELCKGRNECVCVGVCFDYFLVEGDDLGGGGKGQFYPDLRLTDNSEEETVK